MQERGGTQTRKHFFFRFSISQHFVSFLVIFSSFWWKNYWFWRIPHVDPVDHVDHVDFLLSANFLWFFSFFLHLFINKNAYFDVEWKKIILQRWSPLQQKMYIPGQLLKCCSTCVFSAFFLFFCLFCIISFFVSRFPCCCIPPSPGQGTTTKTGWGGPHPPSLGFRATQEGGIWLFLVVLAFCFFFGEFHHWPFLPFLTTVYHLFASPFWHFQPFHCGFIFGRINSAILSILWNNVVSQKHRIWPLEGDKMLNQIFSTKFFSILIFVHLELRSQMWT